MYLNYERCQKHAFSLKHIMSTDSQNDNFNKVEQGKLNHIVYAEGKCANMYSWAHICTYQEAPSGLVVFMRPYFFDCSRMARMNIQWAQTEWLPGAQEKTGQSENVPSSSHSNKYRLISAQAHTRTHTCMHAHTQPCSSGRREQQWQTALVLQRWQEIYQTGQ